MRGEPRRAGFGSGCSSIGIRVRDQVEDSVLAQLNNLLKNNRINRRDLAEREGFEPSVELLNPTTV